eukprot:109984-Prymnesium_polylepis.3
MAAKSWSRSRAWQTLGAKSSLTLGWLPPKNGKLGRSSDCASRAGSSRGSIARDSRRRLVHASSASTSVGPLDRCST